MQIKLILLCIFCFIGSLQAEKLLYDQILVTVNNKVITKNDVDLAMIQDVQANRVEITTYEQEQAYRKKMIKKLIDDALLNARVEEIKINITDKALDDEVDEFKKRRKLNQLSFEEFLDAQNFSLSEFKLMLSHQMSRRSLITREVHSKLKVDEDELKAVYNSQGEKELEIRARHILRKVDSTSSDKQIAEILEELKWIRQQILDGKKFGDIALDYSQDPSAKTNLGDLGYFKPDQMVPEFSKVVSTISLNTLSEPFRTEFGFHIVEVLEKKEGDRKPFEEVKEQMRRKLYSNKFQKKMKTYMASLKENAKIKYL